ncbi:uncharacterized protein LOC143572164 [Bidens hawaiensis]|uniref:uncharacterized protein LOC143572164 n=1 Tax=Bidens hawaiensis TaxID=980011 RepID=UPI004049C0AF
MGLDDVYQLVRTSILTKDPLPTVKGAFAIISSEESLRTITSSNKSQPAAFASKTSNYKKPRSPLKCTHCNKNGHVVEKCYELLGYPPNYKAKIKNTTSNNVVSETKKTDEVPCQLTPEQYSNIMIMLNESVTPDQNTSHLAGNVRFNCATSFFTCASPPKEGNCRGWVIDSGANQHMVLSSKNMFDLVDVSSYNMTVGHPNGTNAKIASIGKLKIGKNVVLVDVLVVPEYCVNLLSVYKLAKDNKLGSWFNEFEWLIQDLACTTTLLTGKQVNDVYYFGDVPSGYKLYSLDEKKVFYSRDVKFYENYFPLKDKLESLPEENGVNRLNFFDFCFVPNDSEIKMHDDEGRESNDISPNLDGLIENEYSCGGNSGNQQRSANNNLGSSPATVTLDIDADPLEADIPLDTNIPTQQIIEAENLNEEIANASFPEGTSTNSNKSTRKSSRVRSIPRKYIDYVVEGNVKYGTEKSVNYSNISYNNKCFVSLLDKSVEPKTYSEAFNDINWLNAMNQEMEALNRNRTWIVTDLPSNRKVIGCKWIYKIKYKSNGEIER